MSVVACTLTPAPMTQICMPMNSTAANCFKSLSSHVGVHHRATSAVASGLSVAARGLVSAH